MENEYKRKPKRASSAGLDHLFVGARKWTGNWEKSIFSSHSPVREACKSIHHGMTVKPQSSLVISAEQSFGISEGGDHTGGWNF